MAKPIQDIQPKGIASAYIDAPFDKGKEQLESEGYHIISLEENARLRIQEGKNAFVSQNGNWTREGFLYVKGKGKYLTKNSPVMAFPKEATDAHRNGNEFYSIDEQIELALTDSIKLPNRDFSIPVKRFNENEIAVYAFGNSAKDYGDFLNEAGIKEMPVWMVDNLEDKSFVRQAWLCGLGNDSRLGGDSWDLSYGDLVRGVCEVASATELSQKISAGYTKEQIKNALKRGNLSGLENTLFSLLR